MKQMWANMLVSLLGRWLFPIILMLIANGIAWMSAKIPFLAPLFEMVNPYELAMGIVCLLFTFCLQKMSKTLGIYIKPLQRWLAARGYILKDDGWFGDKTSTALEEETNIPIREAVALSGGGK